MTAVTVTSSSFAAPGSMIATVPTTMPAIDAGVAACAAVLAVMAEDSVVVVSRTATPAMHSLPRLTTRLLVASSNAVVLKSA